MAKRIEAATPAAPSTPGPAANEVLPQFFTQDRGEQLPAIEASPMFVFTHHRKRWTILDGRVVPDLSKFPLTSGVNRVFVDPKTGRIKMEDAEAALKTRGHQIIPFSAAPNGRTYLQQVTTMLHGKPATAVISVWDTAHAGESSTSFDVKGYADWLESLVKRGIIAPITPHRAAEELKRVREGISRIVNRAMTGKASNAERLEVFERHAEIWERLCTGQRGTPVRGTETLPDMEG